MSRPAVSPEVAAVCRQMRDLMRKADKTQRSIQESRVWGTSHISQIFSGSKAFRLQTFFDLLDELDETPEDFFRELNGARDCQFVPSKDSVSRIAAARLSSSEASRDSRGSEGSSRRESQTSALDPSKTS